MGLDNSLFSNDEEKKNILLKVFEIFKNQIVLYGGDISVVESHQNIIDELNHIKCSYNLFSTNKVLFSKNKQYNYKIAFNNEQLSRIISLILKFNLTFDGYGYSKEDKDLLSIVINDQDGSYITFNNKVFEKEKYKQLLKNILKLKSN